MNDSLDEAARCVSAAATASPGEDILEIGARAADAIVGSVSPGNVEVVPARSARVSAGLLAYGPHAALAAWLIAVAWMAGSHFVGPARTVVQQDSVQSAEMDHAAQKMAAEPHTQKADGEAMLASQTLSTKDVTGLGNTKPRLDAAKTEVSATFAEPSGKVEHLRPQSAEKPSKATERVDRIGLEIVALLAAAPVADLSVSAAPVTRKRAKGGRGDAFDPSLNPTAPGAPRPLGIIAPEATAKSWAYAHQQRTN
jgi:hypothetical protein